MTRAKQRSPIVRPPGAGRAYPMGPLDAVFKADGDETRGRYSISEWWLDPYTRGPGAHQHGEDDVFFVLDGTMSFFVGGAWIYAPKGSLVIAPGGTPHDFENRTGERAGVLNFSVPGDFEPHNGVHRRVVPFPLGGGRADGERPAMNSAHETLHVRLVRTWS